MKLGYRILCWSFVTCVLTSLVYKRMHPTRDMDTGKLVFFTKEFPKPYHGHDFLKDPQFKFDERFKNPCWFDGDRLRCLPYCLLYGFRKCGTTSLFSILTKHPDVVDWGRKETQFFGYSQLYKIDGSPDSMYVNYDWRLYPGNENLQEPKILASDYIHHFLPKAKLLVTVRDPIERLYSEYYFLYGKLWKQNNTNPQSFHKSVVFLIGLYRECFSRNTVRACVYNNTIRLRIGQFMWLNLGIYYIYMEDTFRVYGRENVLVLHMEDINNTAKLRTIFKFLDLKDLPKSVLESISSMTPMNARLSEYSDTGEMLPATRRLLEDFYRPFNERMADLMNDKYYLFTPNP